MFIYPAIYSSKCLSVYLSMDRSIYLPSKNLWILPKPLRSATPRFGRAVARVRTRHLKRQRRAAASFIRKAMKGDDRLDLSKKTNQQWMDLANLKPIFQFLAKQWSIVYKHRSEILSRCGVPTSKVNHFRWHLQIAECMGGAEQEVWLWFPALQ